MERFAAGISFPHTVQFKQSQICSIVNDEHWLYFESSSSDITVHLHETSLFATIT